MFILGYHPISGALLIALKFDLSVYNGKLDSVEACTTALVNLHEHSW